MGVDPPSGEREVSGVALMMVTTPPRDTGLNERDCWAEGFHDECRAPDL